MRLLCYHPDRGMNLSPSRRYTPEQVERIVGSVLSQNQPVYLEYMGGTLSVKGAEARLASALASLYHNQCVCILPPSDGWQEETEAMERAAVWHMQSPSSDESDGGDGSI